MLFNPAIPFLNSIFDLVTITFVSALIILSFLSLCFIFHLRLKSKFITHLQNFNSLWTVRSLLVLYVTLWAITELFRLTLFRYKYLYPFFPSLAKVLRQETLCKVHIVLSLGLFEPAFLLTLLSLLNASIKNMTRNMWHVIVFVLLTCFSMATLQGFLLFFVPLKQEVPLHFLQSSMVLENDEADMCLCVYPLLNSVVFAVFGATYSAWFVLSCWRVLSLVINKGLRRRIYGLASVVMVAVPLQVVCLGLTMFWSPNDNVYAVVSFVAFFGVVCTGATGEGILVIKAISDALDAGGNHGLWGGGGGGGSGTNRHNETVSLEGEENNNQVTLRIE
ncbi:hypothetical protein RJT34_01038 [Clitoria ternatea]|uniref:Uncharacterized protein n=1 Tax=Clitoria ternatea TaxID=43366 RepID=A0AAN9KIX7_CLITE